MSRATPRMRDFAERLIAFETGENASSGAKKSPPAFSVLEKLRPHLATLMGSTGVRTLFSRALTVTREEVGSLNAVQVKADGSLAWPDGPEVQADPEELVVGSMVLVAQVLGLLTAFIGETLTLQLVREAWPNLPPGDLDSSKGREHEKTN